MELRSRTPIGRLFAAQRLYVRVVNRAGLQTLKGLSGRSNNIRLNSRSFIDRRLCLCEQQYLILVCRSSIPTQYSAILRDCTHGKCGRLNAVETAQRHVIDNSLIDTAVDTSILAECEHHAVRTRSIKLDRITIAYRRRTTLSSEFSIVVATGFKVRIITSIIDIDDEVIITGTFRTGLIIKGESSFCIIGHLKRSRQGTNRITYSDIRGRSLPYTIYLS